MSSNLKVNNRSKKSFSVTRFSGFDGSRVQITTARDHRKKIDVSDKFFNSVNLNNSEDPKVIFEVVSKCINSIIDGDEIHTRDDFSDKELMSFLDSMSMDMFEKIQAFFVNVKKLKINGSYDCEKCGENNSYELMGIGNFFG